MSDAKKTRTESRYQCEEQNTAVCATPHCRMHHTQSNFWPCRCTIGTVIIYYQIYFVQSVASLQHIKCIRIIIHFSIT